MSQAFQAVSGLVGGADSGAADLSWACSKFAGNHLWLV